jgi:hypothetical protein
MADYNSIHTGEEIDAAVGNAKTAADLKTAYESNADTNAFTDAEKNKLSGIETGAEVNAVDSVFGRTGAVTAQIGDYTKSDVGLGNVDNTSDVNKPISIATQIALDAKQGSLTLTTIGTSGASTLIGDTLNIPNYAVGGGAVDSVNGATGVVVLTTGDITEDTDANYVTDAQLAVIGNTSGTNTGDQDISGIATNASAISTLDGQVVKKSDYTPSHSILLQQSGTGSPESLSIGTNTLVGRLSGGGSEIDDLSASQVRTLLNVEDGADVTDTVNVTAAGALMDSEVVNLDQVKAFDSADYATAAQGALADSALQNVVEDTTPKLGGGLDTQGNAITGNYATDGHRVSVIESTSARTLSLTDAGDRILFQNGSASTCTIPTNATVAFPLDIEIDIVDMTDGLLTIVADTGVTLNGVSAGSTTTTAKWAGATLIKIATDSWLVFGKINDVA